MKYISNTTVLDIILFWLSSTFNLNLRYIWNYLFLSCLIDVVSETVQFLFCLVSHSEKVSKRKYWYSTEFWMKILFVRYSKFGRRLNAGAIRVRNFFNYFIN